MSDQASVADRYRAANKKIKEDLGDEFEVDNPLGDEFEVQSQQAAVAPHKGIGRKMYERFWGSDVEDPLPWTRLGTQIGGGLGGAWAGAAAGGAAGSAIPGVGSGVGALVGGLIGSAAGTVAGSAAPEGGMEIAEALGVIPEGTRKREGLSDEDLRTVMEGEMLLDAATGGGIAAARLFTRGGIKLMSGIGKAERALADEAGLKGIDLLPVQVGKRSFPRAFVAVLGKFPIVAGPIRSRMMRAEDAYKKAFEALPADIAPLATRNNISLSIMSDARKQWQKVSTEFGDRYKKIFERADQAGARVDPTEMSQKTTELLKGIKDVTPTAFVKGKRVATESQMGEVKGFIEQHIRPMFKATRTGVVKGVAPQTFEQMDTVLTAIDTKIGELGKKGYTKAIMRLEELKNAVRKDMYFNIRAADPQTAANIAADFQATDKAYTETVADLFETSVAKRFGTVRKGGIRGASFDVEKNINVEQLSDILMRGDAVDDLEDLSKIVDKDTFKSLAAYTLDRRMQDAYVPTEQGRHVVNLDALEKGLGLDKPRSPRAQHTARMLEISGGADIEDVQKMIQIGKKLEAVEVPNPSTFIARRGTMGGVQAILSGILPTVVAGGAGQAAAGYGGGLLASAMFLGGSHMLGRMITDPLAAKSLKYVLKEETSKALKKKMMMAGWRSAVRGAVDAGEYTEEEGLNLISNMELFGQELDRKLKSGSNEEEDFDETPQVPRGK